MTAQGVADRTSSLVRFGASAAVVAGALRIASSFIPYEANSAPLETLYAVIDVGLMFGLMAIYISSADAVGLAGLAAFIVALTGLACIVGPDPVAFGIDFYRIGALVFVLGLAGLSVQLLRARKLQTSAGLWLVTLAAGLAAPLLPQAFVLSGVALGTGFGLAGLTLMRREGIAAMSVA